MLDPSQDEEASASGSLLVASMPSLNEITNIVQKGSLEQGQILQVFNMTAVHLSSFIRFCFQGMEVCLDGCAKIRTLMHSCLLLSEKSSNQ